MARIGLTFQPTMLPSCSVYGALILPIYGQSELIRKASPITGMEPHGTPISFALLSARPLSCRGSGEAAPPMFGQWGAAMIPERDSELPASFIGMALTGPSI